MVLAAIAAGWKGNLAYAQEQGIGIGHGSR